MGVEAAGVPPLPKKLLKTDGCLGQTSHYRE